MMKQVHERANSLEFTVSVLRKSLEYTQSEVDELKTKVKKIQKEKAADKNAIQDLKNQRERAGETIRNLDDRCDYLENYSRRNNLHITGVQERAGGKKTWEQTAELVQKKCSLRNCSSQT